MWKESAALTGGLDRPEIVMRRLTGRISRVDNTLRATSTSGVARFGLRLPRPGESAMVTMAQKRDYYEVLGVERTLLGHRDFRRFSQAGRQVSSGQESG